MTEYIRIEFELAPNAEIMHFRTNVRLAEEGDEVYKTPEAMEEGSALAQALATVEGLFSMSISEYDLFITRDPATPWHIITNEVTAALKEFFL
jgi:hypothetical protein